MVAARPPDVPVRTLEQACRHLEAHCDEPVSLEALADVVHTAPDRLRKAFTAALGVSPKQFHDACRTAKLKGELRKDQSVTDAVFAAGYGSLSRVYEKTGRALGMTPKQYQKRGAGLSITTACADTPYGMLLLGATTRGVCFLQFGPDEAALKDALFREFDKARLHEGPADKKRFAQWVARLSDALTRRHPMPRFPLDIRATAFQRAVYDELLRIPRGETRAYGQVAEAMGRPRSVRAVASACAKNKIALLVPCHRVIRGDGSLGGYRWGLETKRALLDDEGGSSFAARGG